MLECITTESESPVYEALAILFSTLSRAEHEEFRLNPPGPPGKAKYSQETDSEQVP